jgi:hypothetical protein
MMGGKIDWMPILIMLGCLKLRRCLKRWVLEEELLTNTEVDPLAKFILRLGRFILV